MLTILRKEIYMKRIKKTVVVIILTSLMFSNIAYAQDGPYYNKYENPNYDVQMEQEQDAHFYQELALHPEIDLMTCRTAPTKITFYSSDGKVGTSNREYGPDILFTGRTIIPDYTAINPYTGEILDGEQAGFTLATNQVGVIFYGNGIIYKEFDSYRYKIFQLNNKGEYEILTETPFGDISKNSLEALILCNPECYNYYLQGNDPQLNPKAMYCYEQWVWYKSRVRFGEDLWPIVETQAEKYAHLYAMNFCEYYLGLKE